jgi:hypothetical protein
MLSFINANTTFRYLQQKSGQDAAKKIFTAQVNKNIVKIQ